jgi:hypothetical protein
VPQSIFVGEKARCLGRLYKGAEVGREATKEPPHRFSQASEVVCFLVVVLVVLGAGSSHLCW